MKRILDSKATGFVLTLMLLLPLAACHGGSNSPTAATNGSLTIQMKDAPTDELSAVTVFISSLQVKESGMPVKTVASNIGPINLMDLVTHPVQLVTAEVDPGDYEFIMVHLDPDQSSVTELGSQATLPLTIPSTEIKVLGGFTVDPDHATTVTLDFMADKSLIQKDNGSWLMKPVIVMDNVGYD